MSQITRFFQGISQLQLDGDSGSGQIQNQTLSLVGGTNVTTSVSGNTVTINSSGGVTSPSFEGDGGGTASPSSGVLQMDGGLNLTSSASGDTVTYDMDNNISSLDSIQMNSGGSLQTSQSVTDTYTLDAYDTSAASYTTFATLTAGNPPTADLSSSVTMAGNQIYYASGPDVALADGGTGIDASGATDGQLLIGGTASNDLQLSTLTAGNNISITNGTNAITIATTSTSSLDNLELAETDSTGSVGVISMQNSSSGVQERILHTGDNGQSGLDNFFAGSLAGNFSITGVSNVGIGTQSLQNLASGGGNSAVGYRAGFGLSDNISAGANTNIAIGDRSLSASDGGTSDRISNIAIGSDALSSLTDNTDNVGCGVSAFLSLVNGQSNIGLGNTAGSLFTSNESNNICIGSSGSAGDNNTIRIGNSTDHSSTFITGIQGVTPGGTSEATIIDGNGQLGSEAQLAQSRGGTGIDSSGAIDGQLLIGGTASNDLQLNTLTAGSGINITNGTNSITISASGGGGGTAMTWNTVSSDTTMSPNNGYVISDNSTDVLYIGFDTDLLWRENADDFRKLESQTLGSNGIMSLDSDDSWLYAAGGDATIWQLDKTTLTVNNSNTSVATNTIRTIDTDGASSPRLYLAGDDASVWILDPSDMSLLISNTSTATNPIQSIATDSSWLYAAGDDATIWQLDKFTPSTVNNSNSSAATNTIRSVITDGTWVYAAGDDATIWKIDPSDMSVDTSNSSAATGIIRDLEVDSSWLYAAGDDTTIWQIDKSTLTVNNSNTSSLSSSIYALELDDQWVFAGGDDSSVYRLDPSDMSENGSNTTPSSDNIRALNTNTTNVYRSLMMPLSVSVGERFAVAGYALEGWQIDQNAGQTIHFGSTDSSTGISGNLSSTQRYDCVEMVCTVAGQDSEFVVRSSIGNIDVT